MIPTLRTTPHLGRDGLNIKPFTHFAMSGALVGNIWEPVYYSARSDLKFSRSRARGDIGQYRTFGAVGAFQPLCHLFHGGKLFVGGRTVIDSYTSVAILFVAGPADGWVWRRISIGFETHINNVFRSVAGLAANSSTVVALISTGERSVSTDDGASFTGYGSIGFTGSAALGVASSLAASSAGFVSAGINGQLFTAANPAQAWSARTSQFGSDNINALGAGDLLVAVGRGKISTASLTNLATWTARTVPDGVTLDTIMARPGRFFAGGVNAWVTSINGTSWSASINRPWGSINSRPRGGYYDGARWVVHYGNGQIAVSSNETTWAEVSDSGLPDERAAASAFVG